MTRDEIKILLERLSPSSAARIAVLLMWSLVARRWLLVVTSAAVIIKLAIGS